MRYLSIFHDAGKKLKIRFYEISNNTYMEIKTDDSPNFCFTVDSPQDITNFKNSVLQAYEAFLKRKIR